jgi:hypothetical protein
MSANSLRSGLRGPNNIRFADGQHIRFKSVDFKPFFDDSKITTNWEVHRQTIELTEEATHWQVSIAIKGPAKVWIDGLEVLSE